MNISHRNISAKRLLLGGVAILGVAALAGCGGGDGLTAEERMKLGDGALMASFASGALSVAEDGKSATITVNLSQPAPTGGLTIAYTTGGTAGGTDYAGLTGSVTVPAGERAVTIPVTITDDKAREAAETLVLTLTAGDGYELGTGNTFRLTITDNDGVTPPAKPVVSLSGSEVSLTEGGMARTITVTLSAPAPAGGLKLKYTNTDTADRVTYGFSNGVTAPDDSDELIVPVGIREFTVTITAADDDTSEGDEAFTVTIEDGTGYTVDKTKNTLSLAVSDPLPPGAPELSVAATGTVQVGGTVTVTVMLNRSPDSPITLMYTVDSGTPQSVMIPASHQGAFTFMVPTTGKTAGQNLVVELTGGGEGTGYTVASGRSTHTVDVRAAPIVINDRPSVGTPVAQIEGTLTGDRIQTAFGATTVRTSAPTIPSVQTVGHWGFWLDNDNNLNLWALPPADNSTVPVGSSGLDSIGTATYDGKVAGLAYRGPRGALTGGEFGANISLTADFGANTLGGTVSSFTGAGAGWPNVTLDSDGNAVSGNGVDGGSWSGELYRAGSSGAPDGVTGTVDIDFDVNNEPGRARGAFHAVKQP